jgi:hypothetical protein
MKCIPIKCPPFCVYNAVRLILWLQFGVSLCAHAQCVHLSSLVFLFYMYANVGDCPWRIVFTWVANWQSIKASLQVNVSMSLLIVSLMNVYRWLWLFCIYPHVYYFVSCHPHIQFHHLWWWFFGCSPTRRYRCSGKVYVKNYSFW